MVCYYYAWDMCVSVFRLHGVTFFFFFQFLLLFVHIPFIFALCVHYLSIIFLYYAKMTTKGDSMKADLLCKHKYCHIAIEKK